MGINSRYDRLEQLQRLQQLEQLERLKYYSKDYRELDVKPDDVVYCDPPYIGTHHQYGGFDNETFENWYLHECPAKEIYISEYTKLPHTEVAFNFGRKQNFTSLGKRKDELLLKVIK